MNKLLLSLTILLYALCGGLGYFAYRTNANLLLATTKIESALTQTATMQTQIDATKKEFSDAKSILTVDQANLKSAIEEVQSAMTELQSIVRLQASSSPMGVPIPRQLLQDINETPETFSQQRDRQRRSDVNTILNALYQYAIDHNGEFPPLPSDATEICDTSSTEECGDLVDLRMLLGNYLIKIPVDPLGSDTENGTGYRVVITAAKRVTVDAMKGEGGTSISVTR